MLYGTAFLTIEKACFNSLLQTAIRASFLLFHLATILSRKGFTSAVVFARIKQLIHHSEREYNIVAMYIPNTQKKKDEFYLDQTFDNVAHAKRAAKNAIN